MARKINLPQPPSSVPENGLGPAMLALTPLMRAFVIAKVFGGMNNADAARAAGYHGRAKQVGYMLAHDVRVGAAILETGRQLMRSEGPKSILTLVKIRDDEGAEDKDRIKAAVELLNRSGFHAVSEHHLHEHHHLSEGEMDRRILALCAELGLSPEEAKKMLVAPADFERNRRGVYELPAEPAPEPSAAALACRRSRARRKGKSPEEWQADKAARRAAHAERMRRERAEHDARRAAEEAQQLVDAEALAPEFSTFIGKEY